MDPAHMPLLTVVVISPTAIKHALALYVGLVYWFAPTCTAMATIRAAGPLTLANEQFTSLDVYVSTPGIDNSPNSFRLRNHHYEGIRFK